MVRTSKITHGAMAFICLLAVMAGRPLHAQPAVSIAFDTKGLSSIKYNGAEFLNSGTVKMNQVLLVDSGGGVTSGSTSNLVQVNAARQSIGEMYPWGAITVQYGTSGNRLNLTVYITNTSNTTLHDISLDVLALQFSQQPFEYDGSTPLIYHNIGGPTVITMSTSTAVVAFANQDLMQPLLVGFPFASNPPALTAFPLRVNTGIGPYSDRLPDVGRDIVPGQTDRYDFSLRFGPAAATAETLAADIYQGYAALHPSQLTWNDRRSIGSLFMASSNAGYPTNPRGWFNDPSIDVTSPAGVQSFQQRALDWADSSITVLQGMNAQGMIFWDLEGEQYANPVTYIGDPRMLGVLAPEMDGIADQFFGRFRNAGFRLGLTIRPQQLVVAADGTAQQNDVQDPASLLIDKIAYARNRWGITLFYIDSNGDPSLPMDASIIQRVAAAYPDVLLIPEHSNYLYYSVSAPYVELRQGKASSPIGVRTGYPQAFTIVNTADGPIADRYSDLLNGVKGGDVLMFRGWFMELANYQVQYIYNHVTDASNAVSPSTQ